MGNLPGLILSNRFDLFRQGLIFAKITGYFVKYVQELIQRNFFFHSDNSPTCGSLPNLMSFFVRL